MRRIKGLIMQELNLNSNNSIKLIYDKDSQKFQNLDYIRTKTIREAKRRYRDWKVIRDREIRGVIIFV
ncbi:MAG: hypothetical protein ACTSRG_20260 [Candidatus Helarchaeota archaeon]